MPRKLYLRIILLLLPLIALLAVLLLREKILYLLSFTPPCPFYSLFNLSCPSCGNTRAIMALLRFDIIGSLRYNITPLLLLICAIILYIELAAWCFGKRIKIITRNIYVLYVLLFVAYFYFLFRNFMNI